MIQVQNTLIILKNDLNAEDLKNINKRQIFFVVAPYLTNINKNCFQNYYNLKYFYSPLLKTIGTECF